MVIKFKVLFSVTLIMILFSCTQEKKSTSTSTEGSKIEADVLASSAEIRLLLDSLNVAAANANYAAYFSYFTENATYNGTDATENWDKKSFMAWAKPYFDAKTTWDFKTAKRNIYFGKHNDIAWFDELLSTQMKICRGSGVVLKQNEKWKIQQYVLSMTIPNSQLDKVVAIKSAAEDSLLSKIKNKSIR